LEGGSWKGCENVRNKELVVYSYEQRRMEATFRGDQDSYRVVEPMMIMLIKKFKLSSTIRLDATGPKYGSSFSNLN
jgi:hypothetical protein